MSEIIFPEGVTWDQRYLTGGDMYAGNPPITAGNLYKNAQNAVIDIEWDTSNVTDMSCMFEDSNKVVNIYGLDTSSATNMKGIFSLCGSLASIPQLDTSNVTDMSYMFNGCSKVVHIPDLDTSNVTDMTSMFSNCSLLVSIPRLDTSKVKRIGAIFSSTTKLITIPLLDFGSVTDTTGPWGYSSTATAKNLGGFKNLKLSWSTGGFKALDLTVESLMNVINNLWDWTDYPDGKAPLNDGTIYNFGTTHNLYLGSTNLNKLSDEQKAIATNKGWTLS